MNRTSEQWTLIEPLQREIFQVDQTETDDEVVNTETEAEESSWVALHNQKHVNL